MLTHGRTDGRTDLSSSRLLTQMSLFETGKKEEKERRKKEEWMKKSGSGESGTFGKRISVIKEPFRLKRR